LNTAVTRVKLSTMSVYAKVFVGLGVLYIIPGAIFESLNPGAQPIQMILVGVGWALVGLGFDRRSTRQKVIRGLGFAFAAAGVVVGVIGLVTHAP
jgi:hypothetical protein